jgi:trehalose 6-phosphate phosphatase
MTPPTRRVPSLLAHWHTTASQFRAGSRVAIFLDFDGTLVDIAPRPQLVRLKPATRRILERLARRPLATLVVISGRRREELVHYIGIPNIRYLGLYGWESSRASAVPFPAKTALRKARLHLEAQLRAYPSVWIENKRSSFSVHLLDVPAALQSRVRSTLRSQLKRYRHALRSVENLRDVEVLPRSIPGKGRAVRRLLAQPAFRGAFPFYFGDDFSDESGFLAVRRGISVHVGKSRTTHARFSLRNPAEVTAALLKLEAELSERADSVHAVGASK